MSRNFGHAPGSGSLAAPAADPHTSEGLLELSRRDGALSAAAAAMKATMQKRDGKRSVVRFGESPDGEVFAVLDKDRPKDPRTSKQKMADEWVKQYGPCSAMPRLR